MAPENAGIRVRWASVARPSLDDVYLRHTGHTFASAQTRPIVEGASA